MSSTSPAIPRLGPASPPCVESEIPFWLTTVAGLTKLCSLPAVRATAEGVQEAIRNDVGGHVRLRLLRNGLEYTNESGHLGPYDHIRTVLELAGGAQVGTQSDAQDRKDPDGDIRMEGVSPFRPEEIARLLKPSASAQQRALQDRPAGERFGGDEKRGGIRYHAPKLFIANTGWGENFYQKFQKYIVDEQGALKLIPGRRKRSAAS